jgi:hypothetical protein
MPAVRRCKLVARKRAAYTPWHHRLAECIEAGFAAQSERFLIVDQPDGLEDRMNDLDPEAQFFSLVESEC